MTTVNEFIGPPATMFQTSYAYDPLRQITSVTDNQNNVTSVVYDQLGRRTRINSPDAGPTKFFYDLADNLTSKQTANLPPVGGPSTLTRHPTHPLPTTPPTLP